MRAPIAGYRAAATERPERELPESPTRPRSLKQKGKIHEHADLSPPKECAELWHEKLLDRLPNVKLTLLLSRYAQAYYLGDRMKGSLTQTVESWREYVPDQLPLPHPSPRNNLWLKKNPWLEKEVIPYLRRRVGRLLR